MEATPKPLLIIFYRNPRAGAVKTRLAATVGNERALNIYNKLALRTRDITSNISIDKTVFYSELIDDDDIWSGSAYSKAIQEGDNLGERMMHAFHSGFETGHNRICIIGTDCLELDAKIIESAFRSLESVDAVIGPAHDGGYYLLGTRRLFPQLFTNKQWSTSRVYEDTVRDFHSLGLKFKQLKILRDVDVEGDVPDEWKGVS